MFAACLASNAGRWKVGRTATINSSLFVTAARAAAVDQASSEGASGPLMSFRFNSAMSVKSNPISSLRRARSEEHTSELQSLRHLVCRLLLEKKKRKRI